MPEPQLAPSAQAELAFWRRELAGAGEFCEVIERRRNAATRQDEFPPILRDPFLPMVRGHFSLDRPVRCLEIGCGPLSTLAAGVEEGFVEVTAVDVLGDEYAELLAEHGIEYPIRPQPGRAEELFDIVEPAGFEVAYARNALDHTADVPRAFANLVDAVRVDGIVVLQHHLNEGSNRQWTADHQWNLDLGRGGLVAEDVSGTRYELAMRDDLELVYASYRSYTLDGWIDVVYRRLR